MISPIIFDNYPIGEALNKINWACSGLLLSADASNRHTSA
jgi:hypothetical protein